MMFGLPGAALAMILAAKPERRKAVAGVLGSAAFTAFLTGVTEPLEFAFMFVAPVLFVVHALLTGISICKGDKEVDMKSILGILSLSVDFGDLVMIKAIGADEEQAMTNLIRFFNELS